MMSNIKKGCYKYCIVPNCTSTTIKTPNKIFFHVPLQTDKRKKWCKLMKRDLIGPKSIKYVCEEHFDIENDTENLIKFKLVGGTLKLKSEIYPHKFDCQKVVKPLRKSGAYEKRRKAECFNEILKDDVPSTSGCQPFEIINCDPIYEEKSVPKDPLSEDCILKSVLGSPKKKYKHKRVQVNIKTPQKNKEVQTVRFRTKKSDMENKRKNICSSPESSPSNMSVSSMSSCSSTSSDSMSNTIKPNFCKDTILKINTNIGFYLGLPEEVYFLTKQLSESIASPVRDILISLKKIRLNDPYIRLAIDFDVSTSLIGKIFNRTVPLIANRMKQFIFFPPMKQIYEKLPISFRKRYFKTVSVLDCFEIRIEKPSSAKQQSLTWSEYKHCNTIKYLISITPDGLINYISDGYGGRASDTIIFEDCDFLLNLSPGYSVMADRGFKNISHLLETKGCHLIRPPSVSANTVSSKLEVMETKRIAALRINVERSIGRLRNFSMVAPHSCIDTKVICMLDFIVVIACGMVNVQNKLITCN
ncbi:uncharacterized protein LOC126880873 [Diabrotica virgifera virgifera]|uniref:THAP-type domain-containing protein n=1 Tax=Diabrotica virgifera virgifera TaxID=50390 RepID=A0ABM5JSI3_DIAVI|nr:uncharacterized protein LOC126880873 [Diabrotica virgifera virgifera]